LKVFCTEEKGSDVNIASHLLLDGMQNAYECAIVVSGDSDLLTPIKMVKTELLKTVGVLNPQRISGPNRRQLRKSAGLQGAANFHKHGIRWKQLEDSLFPEQMTDKKGMFVMPSGWK